MRGVDWNLDGQLGWLEQTCAPYLAEVAGLRVYDALTKEAGFMGFGPIESQILHCAIRRYKPNRIVEIGAGFSTLCLLEATKRNTREVGAQAQIVSIDPYPSRVALRARNSGRITLRAEPVQAVETEVFAELEANDVLFVDCSHSVKSGADTLAIYLRIIPALRPGVIVHIHDIYLPYLHPRDVLRAFWDSQETPLLLALLVGNSGLSVLCALSALHYGRTQTLRHLLPDYQPEEDHDGIAPALGCGHFPSSIYLQISE
jgi:predicted O-methyltransferase YrrM